MDYLIHFEDGSSGYLAHHGVKGMKWGVRRTPEQLGHWEKASAKDRVISPKHDLYRISNNRDEFSKKYSRGWTFVSTNQADRYNYRGSLDHFKDFRNVSYMTEYTLNSVKPLTIAGGKTVVEEFMLQSKDPNFKEFSSKNFATDKSMNNYLYNISKKDQGKYKYTRAFDYNTKMNSDIVESLKKKGYDGMVDILDRSSGDYHDPVIVFDPEKNLKVKKQISEEDWWD